MSGNKSSGVNSIRMIMASSFKKLTEKYRQDWERFFDKHTKLEALSLNQKEFSNLIVTPAIINGKKLARILDKTMEEDEGAAVITRKRKTQYSMVVGNRGVLKKRMKARRKRRRSVPLHQLSECRQSSDTDSGISLGTCVDDQADENSQFETPAPTNSQPSFSTPDKNNTFTAKYVHDIEKVVEHIEITCRSNLKYILAQRKKHLYDSGYEVYHSLTKKEIKRLVNQLDVPKSILNDYLIYCASSCETEDC